MRVARGHEGQRLEYRAHNHRIVFAERRRRDLRTHVEEAVRLAASVSIDHGQIGSDRFCGIEGHGQGIEQTARCLRERGMRGRQKLLDQLVEPALAIAQSLWYVGLKLTGPVTRIQLDDALQNDRELRDLVVKHCHSPLMEADRLN